MKEYQRVKVINDNYKADGINKGAIGYIVNIYDSLFCEVEFSNSDGETYAIQAINVNDIILCDIINSTFEEEINE